MSLSRNQSGASAGGDIAGGDLTKNTTNLHLPPVSEHVSLHSALGKWIKQLEHAKLTDETIAYDVANLAFYKRKRTSDDGINGLEAKLHSGGRSNRLEDAQDQKLSFEMILTEWSFYASAQEIFAYLLAKIHRNFNLLKETVPENAEPHILDRIIDGQVLEPIVDECGQVQHFEINLNVALGMLYWLADQCVIRWHK